MSSAASSAGSGKGVGEQVATYAVGQAISFPLNLLFDLLIARALGPAMRGQWFLMIAAVTLVANVLSLSIPAYAVYRLGKDPRAAGLLNVAVLTYAAIVGAVGAAAGVLLSQRGLPFQVSGLGAPQAYALAGVLVAIELYILCGTGLLIGLNRVHVLSRLNVATAMVTLVVGAGAVVLLGLSVVGALTSYLFARGIAAAAMALVLGAPGSGWGEGLAHLVREMMRYGVAGQVGNLAVLIYQRVNLFLVGAMAGPQSVGYYSVAESLSTRLAVLVGPLQVAFAPRISGASQLAAARWAAQLIRTAGLLLLSVALPLLALAGPLVRALYGAPFAPAASIFRLLLPASALTTAAGLVAVFFSGHVGRPIINSLVSIATMAISIPTSYVLVRNFGMTGGAWSALTSGVVIFALVYSAFVARTGLAFRAGLVPVRADWDVVRDIARSFFRIGRLRCSMSPEPSPEGAVERIEPAETSALELALHVSRYCFVAPLVAGRLVLDAGCGVGYGSGEFAASPPVCYVGVDRSVDAIRRARRRYAKAGRLFLVGNVGALPFANGHFDIVLSFEVLEHLEEVDRYLTELRRVLRPGGTCVVSTPNRRWHSDGLAAPRNPYHAREYYAAEFGQLLSAHFPNVTLMGQHDGARVQVVRSAHAAYVHFLDRSGLRRLRRLAPARLRTWVHSTVVNVASWGRGVRPADIESSDYGFTTADVENARVLLGVCRVP